MRSKFCPILLDIYSVILIDVGYFWLSRIEILHLYFFYQEALPGSIKDSTRLTAKCWNLKSIGCLDVSTRGCWRGNFLHLKMNFRVHIPLEEVKVGSSLLHELLNIKILCLGKHLSVRRYEIFFRCFLPNSQPALRPHFSDPSTMT